MERNDDRHSYTKQMTLTNRVSKAQDRKEEQQTPTHALNTLEALRQLKKEETSRRQTEEVCNLAKKAQVLFYRETRHDADVHNSSKEKLEARLKGTNEEVLAQTFTSTLFYVGKLSDSCRKPRQASKRTGR